MPNPWDRQPRQAVYLPEDAELPCPVCGQPTDSLKQYRYVNWVVFYLVGATYSQIYHRACPGCMRRFVARRAALNLLPANLLWFLLVLPWGVGLIVGTYRKGHSRDVIRHVAPEQAALREAQRMAAANEVSWPRVWAVVGVLFAVLPVIGLVFALIAWAATRKTSGWTRTASRVAVGLTAVVHLALLVLFAGEVAGWW